MADIVVDEFLEHFGIKGMHWGIRNERQRELNRASKAKDKVKEEADFNKLRTHLRPSGRTKFTKTGRRADIDRARARIATGALKADKKSIKTQYKLDKAKLGRREARKILKRKKAALYKDVQRSQELRDGIEVTNAILTTMADSINESHRRANEARARDARFRAASARPFNSRSGAFDTKARYFR